MLRSRIVQVGLCRAGTDFSRRMAMKKEDRGQKTEKSDFRLLFGRERIMGH